jgi:prepilin-type N-terminal cleavage/methylation domain-containing protein
MKSGFTLIETLVVLAITILLSTMLIGYTRGSNTKLPLYIDRATVVGVIQRAKNFALEKYKSDLNSSSKICAYGVHFVVNTPSYFIYSQRTNNDCSLLNTNPNCYLYIENQNSCSAFSVKEQSFSLLNNNFFSSASDVYFIPPYFNNLSNATITLKNQKDLNFSLKIIVNGFSISSSD